MLAPPDIHLQKRYCIHLFTIPGPKKPWDWDLFCLPLVQELIQLEIGVKAFNVISQSIFLLHEYLILAFGDIPAIALIMHIKWQNGLSPCQTCNIKGISISCTYYVPLQCDKIRGASPQQYNASDLAICTH